MVQSPSYQCFEFCSFSFIHFTFKLFVNKLSNLFHPIEAFLSVKLSLPPNIQDEVSHSMVRNFCAFLGCSKQAKGTSICEVK